MHIGWLLYVDSSNRSDLTRYETPDKAAAKIAARNRESLAVIGLPNVR